MLIYDIPIAMHHSNILAKSAKDISSSTITIPTCKGRRLSDFESARNFGKSCLTGRCNLFIFDVQSTNDVVNRTANCSKANNTLNNSILC